MGRSYGDSALAEQIISTEALDHFQQFDPETGELSCASGVTLAEIIRVFLPRGWFLPVTPGTKFVTVGGAIASDVHGKNHHLEGSFCDHVSSISVATVSEGTITCSPWENSELFHATCGGMGLTGMILNATIKLRPVSSAYINEVTLKAENLEHALNLFEQNHSSTYSVAWIDCLSTGEKLGRSLIMLGEHADNGSLDVGGHTKFTVPMETPGFAINRHSIQLANTLYYARVRQQRTERVTHYDTYFYPLDSIHHWNKLYGRKGFVQYQFVLPKVAGLEGMRTVLQRIADSKKGSFLAVLKAMGPQNKNLLSFPVEGYTLALDFKMEDGLFTLLDELDHIVLDHGGRLYLAKDARMSEATFKRSYPDWQNFKEVRQRYGADQLFHSLQSQRLGL